MCGSGLIWIKKSGGLPQGPSFPGIPEYDFKQSRTQWDERRLFESAAVVLPWTTLATDQGETCNVIRCYWAF